MNGQERLRVGGPADLHLPAPAIDQAAIYPTPPRHLRHGRAGRQRLAVQRIWEAHGLQPHRLRTFKRYLRNRVRRLDVSYTYEFQGFTYVGHQIEAVSFGMVNGAVMRRSGTRLEVGRTVPVYVDPSDHRNAVLERGLSSMTAMFYALFSVFALITLFLRVFYVAITTDAQPGEQPGAKAGAAAATR